jgi:DNA-binding transcriptional MerR regulator
MHRHSDHPLSTSPVTRKSHPIRATDPAQTVKSAAPAPPVERDYTIGELARELDITTRTIRFYEQRGLLLPARKNTARTYSRADRARLKLILRGKNLGFTLEEIAQYLSMYDGDPAQVAQTRHLLAKVDAAVTQLQQKRVDIERTIAELKDIRRQCQDHLKTKID